MSRLERHEKLVDAMAEAQGVDLTEAMMRGDLSGTDLRGAIFSCTGCTEPEDCAARLEAGENGMPDVAATPGSSRGSQQVDPLDGDRNHAGYRSPIPFQVIRGVMPAAQRKAAAD